MLRPVQTNISFKQQVLKIKEEYFEFIEAFEKRESIARIAEELYDLKQTIDTALQNHFENWKEHEIAHIKKMESRGYLPR